MIEKESSTDGEAGGRQKGMRCLGAEVWEEHHGLRRVGSQGDACPRGAGRGKETKKGSFWGRNWMTQRPEG